MIDLKAKAITHENNVLRQHPEIVQDGYTLMDCNLSQREPHTLVFKGVKGLQIVGGNTRNCDFPESTALSPSAKMTNIHIAPEPEKSVEEVELAQVEAERQARYDELKLLDAAWLKEKAMVDFKLTAVKVVL